MFQHTAAYGHTPNVEEQMPPVIDSTRQKVCQTRGRGQFGKRTLAVRLGVTG
jgi:hypothetical protein